MPDHDHDGVASPAAQDRAPRKPLFWNTWLSDSSTAGAAPIASLAEDGDYVLTLDLSGIAYSRFDPRVLPVAPSAEVREKLAEDGGVSRFEVLLLADSLYFERVGNSPWDGDLQVRVSDIEKFSGQAGSSPFGDGANGTPAYRFGQLQLRLRTKHLSLGTRPLHTELGLSIWSRDRPIDAIEVPVCIQRGGDAATKDLCATNRPRSATASAGWPLDAPPADASLQLVGQGDERIWSVFRRKGEPLASAAKWTVSRTGEVALRRDVQSVLKTMEKAKAERLPALGGTMLNVLFSGSDPTTSDARKVVEKYLSSAMKETSPHRPTLLLKTPSTTLFPLGLAAVPVLDGMEFLGNRFALEMPLARAPSDRPRSAACDLSWISVLAPDPSVSNGADDTLLAVRARLAERDAPLLRRWDASPESACRFSNVSEFGEWMGRAESPETRAGLLLISHHASSPPGTNLLFFARDQSDAIPPPMLRRQFLDGSLAILNACGTGGASALGFVDTLNSLGFGSIIATATEVQAPLAGDFTYCFAKQITENPQPIGAVFDAAIQCLSTLDDYGPRALIYTLLGDRSTTICAQPKDSPCNTFH